MIDGTGRVKLNDELVQLPPLDAARVSQGRRSVLPGRPLRGPGADFGPRVASDTEMVQHFWGNSSGERSSP